MGTFWNGTYMNKPFLLSPAGKDYLWGGSRLKEEFNKKIDLEPLAETWECSVHPDGLSTVTGGEYDGKSLQSVLAGHPEYLGSRIGQNDEFPLLVKLIDSGRDLSIQVHPDDEYAFEKENGQRGKTEMWYILDAASDATIVFGFNNDCTKEMIRNAVEDKTIMNYLQKVKVKKGDVFFVKPGTVHAIGKGCVIAEIQENSNLTYRLFDYDRIDKNGLKRELHLDKALDVIKLTCEQNPKQPLRVLRYKKGMATEFLVRCKYFEIHRILLNATINDNVTAQSDELSFRILLCVDGEGSLSFDNEEIRFSKGQCIFVPAESTALRLCGKAELIDVRG